MGALLIVIGSFAASTVEMIEAATIVLAVSLTYSRRIALAGTIVALLALTVVVGGLGPSLIHYVPLSVLQTLIGVLLLLFGLQWLRKAIMRSAGLQALHDEAAIFRREFDELTRRRGDSGEARSIGFTVAFKGVFLEGLEVAFIVLTFGVGSANHLELAAAGAVVAALLVGGAAVILHQPLSRVPENNIKFGVGLLLSAFGTFWMGEGLGLEWKLGEATILLLVAAYIAVAWLAVRWLSSRTGGGATESALGHGGIHLPAVHVPVVGPVAHFWYDFVVGDSVVLAAGGVGALALTAALTQAHEIGLAQIAVPLAVCVALGLSLRST